NENRKSNGIDLLDNLKYVTPPFSRSTVTPLAKRIVRTCIMLLSALGILSQKMQVPQLASCCYANSTNSQPAHRAWAEQRSTEDRTRRNRGCINGRVKCQQCHQDFLVPDIPLLVFWYSVLQF